MTCDCGGTITTGHRVWCAVRRRVREERYSKSAGRREEASAPRRDERDIYRDSARRSAREAARPVRVTRQRSLKRIGVTGGLEGE